MSIEPDQAEPGALADELWEAAADLEDEGSLVAAAELYRQAVSAYDSVGEESTARRLDLHVADLLVSIGDAAGAGEVFDRVLSWADREGDRLVTASVWVSQGGLVVDRALELVGDALQIDRGLLDQAAELVDRAVSVFEASPGESVQLHARARVLAAEIASLSGRYDAAVEHLDRALSCALSDPGHREGHDELAEEIVLDLVDASRAAGQDDHAEQVLRDARRRALRDRDEEGVWLWTLQLGQHLAAVGDTSGARQWLERLRDQLEIAGDQDYLPEVREVLAGLPSA